jgi:nucleotide-binding universal stress UspA family protein
MKVIWATDGSKGSAAALPYLNGLLNRRENEIVVTAVAPAPMLTHTGPDPAMLLWELVPGYRDRVSNEVTDLVVREVGLLAKSRAEVTSAVRLGVAPSQILTLALEEQADLIVTGAHGHSAVAELLLGSVSHQVAINAHCSVLVARGRKRPRKLLVAYDGSADAEAAIEFLNVISPAQGAEILALSVGEPVLPAIGEASRNIPGTVEELRRWHRTKARGHAQRAVRKLQASGWNASARASTGHPASEILRTARDEGTDLVLIGARGIHSPDEEARGMGGIPRQVLERAPCSVFIARAPASEIVQ